MSTRSLLPLALFILCGCVGEEPGLPPDTAPGDGAQVQSLPSSEDDASDGAAVADTELPASRFELGTQYVRLTPTQPTSSSPEKIEVAEVFRYGSRECLDFEAQLSRWDSAKRSYVNFIRIPAASDPEERMLARAYYTAEMLGRLPDMNAAFYREIQLNGNALDTEAALTEFFGRFGVEAEEFSSVFNSFAVHSKIEQAEDLGRRYRVADVPTIVVNGKYRSTPEMAGGYEALIDLINYLTVSENLGN